MKKHTIIFQEYKYKNIVEILANRIYQCIEIIMCHDQVGLILEMKALFSI